MSTSKTDTFLDVINNKGDCPDLIVPLLNSGMDINTIFEIVINGQKASHSLLSYSCFQNCSKMAKVLIEKGANVNFQTSPDEDTPIHICCKKSNKTIASYLLESHLINLNSINKEDETCFRIALRTSREIYSMIYQKLNQKKTKVTPKPQKPLNSSVKKIKKMLKRKPKNKIEIPFTFRKPTYDGFLSSYINLQQPSVFIDLDELEKSEIKNENNILKEKNDYLERQLKAMFEENQLLKNEVENLNIKLDAMKEEKMNFKCSNADFNLSQNNNNISQRSSNNTNTNSLSNNSVSHGDYLQLKFKSNKKDMSTIKSSLQKDLIDYKDYTKSNVTKDQELLNELLNLLQYTVEEISSEYEVQLYGSRATKLCLFWSDLDVVLIHKPKENNLASTNICPLAMLELLSNSLKAKLWVNCVKYINTAKIPIIKLTSTEKYSSMQIDISIQDSTHCGLKCVDLVKSFVSEFEVLEPLVFAIKTLLKLSSLNDPFTGGLSSYGIILMVVGFLKNEEILGHSLSLDNIGVLFCDLLLYYGGRTNSNFVNVTNMNMVSSTSPFELVIVDPLNFNNNVAKSTFHFFDIKVMFLIALQALLEDCPCGCHYINGSSCNQNEELQHNALRKMFNAVKRVNLNMIDNS